MQFRVTVCLLFAALLLVPSRSMADGLLQQLRTQVREPPSDSTPAPPQSHDDKEYRRNRARSATAFNEDGNSFFSTIGWYALTSPYWGPRVGLEEDTSGVDAWFTNSPYENSNGTMTFFDQPGITKSWFARLQLESGIHFDDVRRQGLRFQGDFVGRFGIDTEAMFYHEDLSAAPDDNLQTGDVNLVYRFAHNERWQFRSGLGYNWLNDDAGTDHGINFTYGADWYPTDPIFSSATLDLGTLGGTSRSHLRAIIGLTRNGFGIYTGYDGLRLGDARVSSWITGIEYRN